MRKKLLSFALAAAALCVGASAYAQSDEGANGPNIPAGDIDTAAETVPVTADVNGDGKVTAKDATALLKIIAGGKSPSEYDVNGDGKTNAKDATAILKMVASSGKTEKKLRAEDLAGLNFGQILEKYGVEYYGFFDNYPLVIATFTKDDKIWDAMITYLPQTEDLQVKPEYMPMTIYAPEINSKLHQGMTEAEIRKAAGNKAGEMTFSESAEKYMIVIEYKNYWVLASFDKPESESSMSLITQDYINLFYY